MSKTIKVPGKLSIDDTAALTGYSEWWLRKLAREGKLRRIKRYGCWYFDSFEVEQILGFLAVDNDTEPGDDCLAGL